MIYITGDTHGDIDRFKKKEISSLKKGDTLLICGDFGFLWDGSKQEQKNIKWLSKRRYNIAFVDGCNENYELLNQNPVEEWNGGQVRKIAGNIFQLMRGEIFNIEDKTFLAFGGGDDSDEQALVESSPNNGEEIPTDEQINNADKNLSKVNDTVDFIITHDVPTSIKHFLFIDDNSLSYPNEFLESLKNLAKFKTWYFGKYHMDKIVSTSFHGVYQSVINLK